MKRYQNKLAAVLLALAAATPATAGAETIYRATTTIGSKVFQDLITFEKRPSDHEAGQILKGTVSVPGVFSSHFEGTVIYGSKGILHAKFAIVARENDQDMTVYYNLSIFNDGESLSGGITFLHGETGTVKAHKIFEE